MGRKKGAAALVVFPESAAEVLLCVLPGRMNCRSHLRGAGTNLTGATVPDGGIVSDLSRMNRILEFDPIHLPRPWSRGFCWPIFRVMWRKRIFLSPIRERSSPQ